MTGKSLLVFCALAIIGIASANAKVSSQLAEKCREMSFQAHPSSLPNTPAVANLRSNYYRLCFQRRANMDPELTNPR